MDLFLQFGSGMKSMTLDLARKWGGASVILSPRDITPKQLASWADDFQKYDVSCYFDPQCYFPQSKKKRLSQYEYWDDTLEAKLRSGDHSIIEFIQQLKTYNEVVCTKGYILPAIMHKFHARWYETISYQSKILIDSARSVIDDKPVFMTLALPKEFLLQNDDIIGRILDNILTWPVDGFYIIAEALEKNTLLIILSGSQMFCRFVLYYVCMERRFYMVTRIINSCHLH
jgi:hypothetical protein